MDSFLQRLARAIVYSIPFFFSAELFFEQFLQTSSSFRFFLSITFFLGGLSTISYALARSFIKIIRGKEKRPVSQTAYRVAERLVEKKRYREAIHEYEKIIHRHPQELRAHLGLIHILKESHRDPLYLQKATRRARLIGPVNMP